MNQSTQTKIPHKGRNCGANQRQKDRKAKRRIIADNDRETLIIWKIYRNKQAGGDYVSMIGREAAKEHRRRHISQNISSIIDSMFNKLEKFIPPTHKHL